MIVIEIIALEFEHSLLVVLEREESIIRPRTVVVIVLAVVQKFTVIDVTAVAANELFALAAAILALGIVHRLVRDQDRRNARSGSEG